MRGGVSFLLFFSARKGARRFSFFPRDTIPFFFFFVSSVLRHDQVVDVRWAALFPFFFSGHMLMKGAQAILPFSDEENWCRAARTFFFPSPLPDDFFPFRRFYLRGEVPFPPRCSRVEVDALSELGMVWFRLCRRMRSFSPAFPFR